jgi:anti-sigma factor RsiW
VNPLAHEEIQELLGAYALHAVEPEESEQIEGHLEECPRCRAEVASHREVAAWLGNSGGDAPEGLWDRIATQLEEPPPPLRLPIFAPESPDVVPLAPRRRARSSRLVVAALGAAAALVIAVLAAQVVRQDDRIADLETAMARGSVADATVATLASADGSLSADALVMPDGTGYLLAGDLPGLAADRTYQLWGVTAEDTTVSLGLLGSDPRQVVPFVLGDVDGMTALAVTEEVAGGVAVSENPAVVAGELG